MATSTTAGRSRRRRRPRMTPDEVHELGQSELERCTREMDAILKEIGYSQGTVGERMNALGEGSALPVLRRRHGPRRDHGVHPESPRLDPGADAARLQHGGQSEHGSEAAAARRRAGRARGLRRRAVDRRQDPRAVLDQPADHRPAQQVQPRRPRRFTKRSPATSGRASTRTTCR